MTTFEMLCGLPGSGKSVYAGARSRLGAIVVSSADVRAAMEPFGGSNQMVFDEMDRICIDALLDGHDVVHDATNLRRRFRMDTLDAVRRACGDGVRLVAVHFDRPLDDAIATRREASDGRNVPEQAVRQIWRRSQPPSVGDGFHEVRHVSDYPGDASFAFDMPGFYAGDYEDCLSSSASFDPADAVEAMERGDIVLPDGSWCTWMDVHDTGFERDGFVLVEPGWGAPDRLLDSWDVTYLAGGLACGVFFAR